MRAAIMGDLVLLAWIAGRDADTLTALGLAGAGMTLVQPEALSDIGFQLSFAGTLGLIVDRAAAWSCAQRARTVAQVERRAARHHRRRQPDGDADHRA